jgi:hypothetical protein
MKKDEILNALEDEREKLLDALEGIPEEDMEKPGVVGEWSIKEMLSHLIFWEAELVQLLWQLQQGEKPTTLHFTTFSVDEKNQQILIETHDRPLERVLADFQGVRKQTVRRVSAFSAAELEEKQKFPWLGEKPLWEWIANDSFEHEAEHTKQIHIWREIKPGDDTI